jgi:hypothetical protein
LSSLFPIVLLSSCLFIPSRTSGRSHASRTHTHTTSSLEPIDVNSDELEL